MLNGLKQHTLELGMMLPSGTTSETEFAIHTTQSVTSATETIIMSSFVVNTFLGAPFYLLWSVINTL